MAENPTSGKPVACMRREVLARCEGRLVERMVDHHRDLAQSDTKCGADRLYYIRRADLGGIACGPRCSLAVPGGWP
jgi:hypothetical protein